VLLEKVFSEGQRGGQTFAAIGRAVLGKIGGSFEGEGCVRDEVAEGLREARSIAMLLWCGGFRAKSKR
jgi:hypothetical protein